MKSTLKYTKSEIDAKIAAISSANPTFTFNAYSDTNGLSIYFIDASGNTHRYSDHPCSDKKGYIHHSFATGIMGVVSVPVKEMEHYIYVNAMGVKRVHTIVCRK